MTLTLAIIGLSIHVLIWEKLPEWGTWFNKVLSKLPKPLQTLYEQWECAFCAGFWIALVLHALTGLWTFPELAQLSGLGIFVAWILDALGTAIMIYGLGFLVAALKLPAMKAYMMEADFKKEHLGE